MTTAASELTPFDPWEPELISNPYPIYDRYREADPVHWGTASNSALPGSWYLFRYEDNAQALIDAKTFASSPESVGMAHAVPPAFAPVADIFYRWLGAMDPPDHSRLRSILAKAFTPRRVAELRPRIELIAKTLLDEALARGDGRVDIISDLSFPLPMTVVGDAMGVPQADWHLFRDWSEDVTNAVDHPGDAERGAAGSAAILGMAEYFKGLVQQRRTREHDDLLGAMVAAADDDGKAMNEFDAIAIATEIAVAGHETTANGVAKSVLGLMGQRDRWEQLKSADEQQMDAAIEELLRWTTPVAKQRWRWATKDTELGGRTIRYGESVVSILESANRDPAQFSDPDRIDFERPAGRHLTFGFGPHFCLGSALARLELRVSYRLLTSELPDMELTDDPIEWKSNHLLPAPKAVWVSA